VFRRHPSESKPHALFCENFTPIAAHLLTMVCFEETQDGSMHTGSNIKRKNAKRRANLTAQTSTMPMNPYATATLAAKHRVTHSPRYLNSVQAKKYHPQARHRIAQAGTTGTGLVPQEGTVQSATQAHKTTTNKASPKTQANSCKSTARSCDRQMYKRERRSQGKDEREGNRRDSGRRT
jgi:hypothetical protein